MDKIKLSKEKLKEILSVSNDKSKMEFYYKAALEDKIEANSRVEIVLFLVMLVRYFYDNFFILNSVNPEGFFNLKELKKNKEYWKLRELLRKTNLEIAYCLMNDEFMDDRLLVEFSEIQSLFYFFSNDYLNCLSICDNAIYRDEENSLCNFLKASIIEICYINTLTPDIKVALLNYQFELISKCKVEEQLFDKQIFNKIFKEITERREKLSESQKKLVLTECFDDNLLSNEQKFYLDNKLLLNPLTNYGKFLEATIEEMENLPTSKKTKKMFDEIINDFKFCRNKLYQFYVKKSIDKREMASVYSYAYSIFDKIAFVIKEELGLSIADDKVSFTQNWLFDCKISKLDITFDSLYNNNIIPLYLIMKGVREKQKILNPLNIGTFEFCELRNTIEHKSISLVDESILKRNSIGLLSIARDTILHTFMLLFSIDKNLDRNNYSGISTTYIQALLDMGK